jgi:hypothetical protein
MIRKVGVFIIQILSVALSNRANIVHFHEKLAKIGRMQASVITTYVNVT